MTLRGLRLALEKTQEDLGKIYFADLDPIKGDEIKKIRPVLRLMKILFEWTPLCPANDILQRESFLRL